MSESKLFNLLTGIAISGLFLYFAIKNVNFGDFIKYVHELKLIFLIPALVPGIIAYLLRAWRWNFFLSSLRKFKVTSLFSATMIGFMSNNILPARIGELIRAFVLSRKESESFIAIFASLIAERIMDGLTVSIVALFVIFSFPIYEEIKIAGYIFFIIFLFLFFFLLFFINFRSIQNLILNYIPQRFSARLKIYLDSFLSGALGLNQFKNFAITFIIGFVIWFFSVLYFYFMGFAMNLHLSFSVSFAIFVSVALGVTIPSSPGFIGVYHFFCQKALEMSGVETSRAFAYAVVTHFVQFVAVTAIGFLFLLYENLSLLELGKRGKGGF